MDDKRKKREKREPEKIVVYSRRPNRTEAIDENDIVQLRIALYSTESVEEFMKSME
jgi:hypothetical protein